MTNNLARMYGIGIMTFILLLSTLVGVPVLPQLSETLSASETEIPIVVSAAWAAAVIAKFFTGILADRYSRRRLILIGALMGSTSSLLCVFATHWRQLVILRVIGGIADAIAMPALLSLTASLGRDQPGKFFGIFRSSQGLSFVVAPALGGLFSFVSLRTPFLVDGLLSFLGFLATIGLLRDPDKVKYEHGLSVFRGLQSTFSAKQVYLYLLMGFSGLFAFGMLYSFVPTKAQLIGMEAWQISVILSGGALIFSTVSYTIGVLSDRFGRRIFAILSQPIIFIAIAGLLFSNRFTTLVAFYGLFCIGETITYVLCFVYATEVFDRRYIGVSMAAFDSIIDLSLFIAPLVGILVYSATDQIAPVFLIAAVPAVLAFFATTIWLKERPKR